MIKRKKLNCKFCNRYFEVPYWRIETAKFCSIKCRNNYDKGRKFSLDHCIKISKSLSGKRSSIKTEFQIGHKVNPKTGKYIPCENCGKLTYYVQERILKTKHFFCSYKCRGIIIRGEKHHMYKDGASLKKYPIEFNQNFVEEIRKRDGYKCQMCGSLQSNEKRKLSVHHIDYNKFNIKVDNLISLCTKCHGKTTKQKDIWINYFSSL